MDDECEIHDPLCIIKEGSEALFGGAVDYVVSGALANLMNGVLEAYANAMASLGSIWVHIGTPVLSGTSSPSPEMPEPPGNTRWNFNIVLGYVTWIGLALAIISLIILGALIAIKIHSGEGIAAVGKVGVVLGAVIIISSASAIVSGMTPTEPEQADGAVLFLQTSLWWYMGVAAIVSVIIGGIRMIWEQRAEPGRDIIRSLLTLIVVASTGVVIVNLLVGASDSFAVWILDRSLSCDVSVSASTACFSENMASMITLSAVTGGLGAVLIIILGLVAVLSSMLQIVLMVARGGMLVILTGILPLAASFTNTQMGKGWFQKCVSWLVAFILYKPAAAIIYAAAFQLVGTDLDGNRTGPFGDDGTGLLSVLTGLMLMIIALLAMPALMRFVTPMVGAMAGAATAGMAASAISALPSGSEVTGLLGKGGHSGGDSGGQPGPTGPQGSSMGGGSRAAMSAGPGGGAGGGAGAGTGAGAAGGAAGGAAAGAGAAAGPIGIAAEKAIDISKKVADFAVQAAQAVAADSTEGGPDGSR